MKMNMPAEPILFERLRTKTQFNTEEKADSVI